ncbi:aldo/keto reductase [Adhaeribacter aquaticus]|uniref:aldo/keto reductase n=1 Tax=Adhaeribacter aquaticus TaxID=299567 RepID=UPI0004226399|nr:aldo/keto reductase [Adhaeribacter aquaticus]
MANEKNAAFNPQFNLAGEFSINRMGYGAMRITGDGIWGPPKDHDESIRVLKRAVELGISFIDTADSYGPHVSEELIAEALHPYPAGLVIATKGGLLRTGPNQWPVNAHPDHLKEALEGSLKRLKLDSIDLYQLHRVDPEVPFEQTLEFLQKVQQEGKIKHIGLSEVTVDQIKKAQEYVKIVSVQNMYSVDNRKWEEELQYCEEQNMAFIPWYPLGGGNVKALEKLEQIGKKYEATAHQIALSWLLHHSPNILLIPGTSKVKHLEENFEAASIALSPEDLTELDKINQAEVSG